MEQLMNLSFYKSWMKHTWKQVLGLGLVFSLVFFGLTWYSHRSNLLQGNQSLESSASLSFYIENKQDAAFTNVALLEEYLKAPDQLKILNQSLSTDLTPQDLDQALTITALAPYNGIGLTAQLANDQESLHLLEAIYQLLERDEEFMRDKDLLRLTQASLNSVDENQSAAALSKKRLVLGLALAWLLATMIGLVQYLYKDRKSPYLTANFAINPYSHEKGIYIPKNSLSQDQMINLLQMGPGPIHLVCQDTQSLPSFLQSFTWKTNLDPSMDQGQIVILAQEGVTSKEWLSQVRMLNQGGLGLPLRILVLGE